MLSMFFYKRRLPDGFRRQAFPLLIRSEPAVRYHVFVEMLVFPKVPSPRRSGKPPPPPPTEASITTKLLNPD